MVSKVKEMCRHSYSLEKTEKMLGIVTCFMYPRVFAKEGSCGGAQNILDLGPLKALIRLCMRKRGICCHPVSVCLSVTWGILSTWLKYL